MLQDVERAIEEYFPAHWTDEQVLLFMEKARFESDINAVDATLNTPIRDIIFRGGKRLRPILFLTLIKIFGGDTKQYIKLAAILELIHNATLVIDDIEDNSELRRGKPTLHNTFGLDIATNTGVAMHILPLRIIFDEPSSLSEEQKVKLLEIYSEELTQLYFGQATDIYWHKSDKIDVSVQKYLEMCRLKTGSLMRMSARFACLLTHQNDATSDALKKFAETVGIAFQIKDDILDLTANKAEFGKAFGNDISEGKISLPVIFAVSNLSPADGKRLLEILQLHTREEELIKEALALIQQTKALELAMEQANGLYTQAWDEVQAVIPAEGRQALEELTGSFITRNR